MEELHPTPFPPKPPLSHLSRVQRWLQFSLGDMLGLLLAAASASANVAF
jgi:hypothetical protein